MSSSPTSGGAHRWRPGVTVATVFVCVGAALPPTGARAVPAAAGPPAPSPATVDGTHTVTLLTGDRVRYRDLPDGRAQVTVHTPPDRRGVTYATIARRAAAGGPALYVVPSDAEPLISAGALDRELFNVRGLTRQGLDDDRSATLPVIATHPRPGDLAPLAANRRTRALPALGGAALRVNRDGAAFWKAVRPPGTRTARPALRGGVGRIWLDARVTASLDHSVPQIGAPEAWRAGYDGRGVKVAVLDSGVDAGHPDLRGRITSAVDFTGSGTTADRLGHGTHVASIIAGSGAASEGRYRGVAPGADLMIGRVLDDEGSGLDSMVIAGMQWAADGGARVVNMSLGGDPTDGTDPLSVAVDELSRRTGALFVVAAGNDGAPVSVNTPGAARAALTVGAVDRGDHVAGFSSRGPRLGDGLIKPEIVAPGVGIVAARADGTELGEPVGHAYTTLSGTSMATPHVAGAAAILAQRRPAWRADRLKDALVSSAAPVDGGWAAVGAGRVDVARATRQDIAATGALQAGADGPTPDSAQYPISYVNDGAEPLHLHLGMTFTGWNGAPAPELGRLSTTELTVPAGGQATATVTIDPAAASGAYGGAVTATGKQVSLRTAVGVYLAPPAARLTVRMTDHHGRPAPFGTVYLVDAGLDPATSNDPFAAATLVVAVEDGTGEATVRRGGVYTALASMSVGELTGRRTDLLVSPEVTVTGDTEITLDARKGQRHTVTTGEATDELARSVEVVRTTAGAQIGLLAAVRTDPDLGIFATPQPATARGDLDTYDKRTLAGAGLRVRAETGATAVDLHPRYDVYRTPARWPGSRQADLVWAGRGQPADLAGLDLRGRLALVAVAVPGNAPDPVGAAAQAATAATRAVADAGAAGILAYVDRTGAVPLARPAATPVPQLFLGYAEGAALRAWLADGTVRITLSGDDSPDSNYNLFYPAAGVPAGRADVATPATLVMIPTRYHADRTMTYEKNWYAFGPRSLSAVRERVQFTAPAVRAEYVGPPDPAVTWIRWTTQNEQPANAPAQTTSLLSRDVFGAGPRSLPEERWYEGPVLEGEPVGGADGCGLCRGGPDGDVFFPAWHLSDSTGTHTIQSWPDYRSRVQLFRDGAEIPPQETAGLPMPTFRLPSEPADYRLEVDGPTPSSVSVRPVAHTTSRWTFRSGPPLSPSLPCPGAVAGGCAHQPLIQLTYRLGLDPGNRAPAGQEFAFEVLARQPQGAQNGGAPAGLWLWSSADAGQTWRPATVRQLAPGRYQIGVRNPAVAGPDGMWLKAEAWDSAGNRLQQTVRGAYGLAAAPSR
ncbi:subtilisin family serine protease [Krasilnikovia cinnamomea]|uniref:Subtilisin family serine protease n=1 Tax=Krasilnikovia cinnamomea TaxID=349313 RepID=A0A4Q7ZTU5_9ACTN|nr:S8 family serine peptidase [Krasilnikovia cinnamomea]RZU53975.1 subtilisin family serine protease [Krasilnikovia cinnamomea]